jgi:predicted GH43/DUF377 family glycosyl hydrolase
VNLKRTDVLLKPTSSRVLFRPFPTIDPQRSLRIVARILALSDEEAQQQLDHVLSEFNGRHQKLLPFFLHRFECVREFLPTDEPLDEPRKMLIGSYFTQEYALESAALFNPSMVWHPDQKGLPKGSRRFIVSLRSTGEGHISSITFRSGVVDAANNITLDAPTRFVTAPEVAPNSAYDKGLFERKLIELNLSGDLSAQVLALVGDTFTLDELQNAIAIVRRQYRHRGAEFEPIGRGIEALAQSNYEIVFSFEQSISERVIFPYSPAETNGIEDARFVEFHDDDGSVCYYATYTAFDGKVVLPQMLETTDFCRFRINTLNGPEVRNKGFALFPRRINGQYAMLSRQDGENIYLMYSDMLHFWYSKQLVMKPTYPWEFMQLGNCGSPIEIDEGWLVLTHGVGPMRKYSIGAVLLDRDDPSRVLGRTQQPILAPNEVEREGYVPNVVYSCGAVVHRGELIIPYAMSDYASTFATIPLGDVLTMIREG